jgi:pilus assembly protein CpaB
MRIGNVTMLIAALVCATAAALLSRSWLVGQAGKERVITVQSETPQQEVRSIVVAARDIRSGEKLENGMFRLMSWPGESVPKGAFTTVQALLKASQDRVLTVAVSESEPILEQKFAGAAQSQLAGRLGENTKAIAIRVNDVAGVAGLVQPEDRVDVFLTTGGTAGEGAASAEKPSVAVLLQNVRVLAIDQAMERERKGERGSPKSVTLEVNTQDAQKLVLAGMIGQLSLALRRSNGVAGSEPRPIAMEDLLARQPTIQAPTGKPGQVIGVTRAAERQEYTVQPDQPKSRRSEVVR